MVKAIGSKTNPRSCTSESAHVLMYCAHVFVYPPPPPINWSLAMLRILDPGAWIQDPGPRMLDPGCQIQDPGCWIRDLGSGLLDLGSWIQDPDLGPRILGSWIQDPGTLIQYHGSRGPDPGPSIPDSGSGSRHLECRARCGI
jgi:hypothetical protein